MCSRPEVVSVKMGRILSVQLGQIAGAAEFRFADNIPAMKVPCRQAVLLARVHAAPLFPGISRSCSPARSACWVATGPSISPIVTSGLPLVRSIKAVSLTNSKGNIACFSHLTYAYLTVKSAAAYSSSSNKQIQQFVVGNLLQSPMLVHSASSESSLQTRWLPLLERAPSSDPLPRALNDHRFIVGVPRAQRITGSARDPHISEYGTTRPPSELLCPFFLGEGGLFGLPLRASNEGLPRPRVARAKGVHQATPSLLTALSAGSYNLLNLLPITD